MQAIPVALASARSLGGWSPSGVVEAVVGLLKHHSGGEDSSWLLALLQAAGHLRPSPQVHCPPPICPPTWSPGAEFCRPGGQDKPLFAKLVKQIHRWLQYDR